MKFWSNLRASLLTRDRVLTWAVPVVLACVLSALAVLQYRWSHQVSEAATTRMQASLQNSMMNFRQDLARELVTMCLDLQGDNASSPDAKRLSRKLEHWQRTSSLSGLVANVYEWKTSDSEDPSLLRLVPSEMRFATVVTWPAPFSGLRKFLSADPPDGLPQRRLRSQALSPTGATLSGRGLNEPMMGAVDQNIPLLIFPASRTAESTWLLVELDTHVLRERLFPQLSERYFGDSRTSEYEVAVVTDRGERPQVLYSSDEGFGKNGRAVFDAALNLFGPPVSHSGPYQPPSGFVRAVPASSSRAGVGPAPSMGFPGGAFEQIRFDPIRYVQDETSWQIVAKHRKGSVAAAVAELRYRNLAISFGVLVVLAVSTTLIIVNSQRARRLAILQMDFVAGVSHELRTPVAAILSISENMVDGVVADEQQVLRYGGIIRNQARRLHHLVEQVLRFAATQRRTTTYTIRSLQISDVVDEVLESMANLIAVSGFVVERRIDPDLPLVEADFGVLSQCLQNLITNAVKYGGESKWIGLSVRSSVQGTSREVSVTVEDHGIGIDHHELRHIFEPFYRSPKIVDSQVPGTGLGLALAKSFAEAMGGRLTVVSEVGKGTAFTVHLPAANGTDARSRSSLATEPAEDRDEIALRSEKL